MKSARKKLYHSKKFIWLLVQLANIMSFSKSKALAVFICFTLATTTILSYTLYLWIGIAGSLRNIEIEILTIEVTSNSDTSNLNVTILIRNPSKFSCEIAYIAIRRVEVNQYSYELDIQRAAGSFRSYYDAYTQTGTPLEIKSYSNAPIHFQFQTPIDPSSLTEDSEWNLLIRLHLITLFNRENIIRLDIERTYSASINKLKQ